MSLSSLNSALSGLRIAQQQMSVISNNVANVGTEGYTRKTLPQSTVSLSGMTMGVRAEATIRNVDMNLARDFWVQVSTTSSESTRVRYLNQIQEFHGPPEAEISLAAEISRLRESFSALSDSPEDSFLLRNTSSQAQATTRKINQFSQMITRLRNDAQNEISDAVSDINALLGQIAKINIEIRASVNMGRSTAEMEDIRDNALNTLSGLIEISFFIRQDGILVVQTPHGEQLADERAETLHFSSTPVGSQSFYPTSAAGLFLRDPLTGQSPVDLTEKNIGGKIGALLEMRDQTLPVYLAQLDELSHKLALRFEAQGLRLFTNASGQIPADTDPLPYIPPGPPAFPGTAVPYVGFSAEIQVNPDILNNPALIRTGTIAHDAPVQSGSNEVIRRILDFALGETDFQQAQGTRDLRAAGSGGVSLQEWLGLYSSNTLKGRADVSAYADMNAIFEAGTDVFIPPLAPVNDSFTLTFSDARIPVTLPDVNSFSVTVSLNQASLQAGANAGEQIVAEINAQIAAALVGPPPVSPLLTAGASLSAFGEIVLTSRANITIDSSGATGMGQEGLDFLGLRIGTQETTDPYFDVQIGNDPPTRITIAPGEDENDLLDKLLFDPAIPADTGVFGLAVDLVEFAASGRLVLRPGDDFAAPRFGGDLRLIGGAFSSDGSGASGANVDDDIITTLFGLQNPITDFAHTDFRTANLGPGVSLSTGLSNAGNIIDFAQKLVNGQTKDVRIAESRHKDEETFRKLLGTQLMDQSGVNIDEELANLIVIQTAYAAAARAVQAINGMFDDLLAAV